MGATPHSRAQAGSERTRSGLSPATMSISAAKRYEKQMPTSPPAARSAKTRSAPATAFPQNEVEVIHVEAEPDPDDLDVGYAQLASEFNSDTANGERRAARERLCGSDGEP